MPAPLIFCLVILLTVLPIHAENEEKIYTIGYAEDTEWNDIAMQRLQKIYQRAGLRVEFVNFPSKRSLAIANAGKVDGELARIPGIESSFLDLRRINVPLLSIRGMAYTKNNNIKGYSDELLEIYSVGMVRGVYWSVNKISGFQPIFTYDYTRLFQMLSLNRVDIILVSELTGDTMLNSKAIDSVNIRKLQPPVDVYPTYHYLHKKHTDIIPRLEAAATVIQQEGLREKKSTNRGKSTGYN